MSETISRGVNLGGWLVLERWMTPSVFEGTKAQDEYSLMLELGAEEAKVRLKKHRDSFITETDFAEIRKAGLEAIRLPIGYWMFGDEAVYEGAIEYVDKAFAWAIKHKLKVLLDFHGLKGSQNGKSHSGRAGSVEWSLEANMKQSLAVIQCLAERYNNFELYGIEIMNEPDLTRVKPRRHVEFITEARQIVRNTCPATVKVVVSDGFRPHEVSDLLYKAKITDVVLDMHLYQLFSKKDIKLDLDGHIRMAGIGWADLIKKIQGRGIETLIGEWSMALDDGSKFFSYHDRYLVYEAYGKAQQRTFESFGCDWFYWSYKTEDEGIWSLVHHYDKLQMGNGREL